MKIKAKQPNGEVFIVSDTTTHVASGYQLKTLTLEQESAMLTAGKPAVWDFDNDELTFPEPDPKPVQIPQSVDAWKLKAVLEIAGKTPTIEAVIDGIEDDTQRIAIRAGWDNAPVIARDNPFVQTMIAIPALDITTEQMDQFFLATKQFD